MSTLRRPPRSGTTGRPFLYQLSTGGGGGCGEATHGSAADERSGSVWFSGPSAMTGGGRGSGARSDSVAFHDTLPTSDTAEHHADVPASARPTDCNRESQGARG